MLVASLSIHRIVIFAGCRFIYWILTHFPLPLLLLCHELCILPAIVDGDNDLPNKEQQQTNENDGSYDAQNDGPYVDRGWAFFGLLSLNNIFIILIDEVIVALITIVAEFTQLPARNFLNMVDDLDMSTVGVTVLHGLISSLEGAAQHTLLVLLTLTRARRTIFTSGSSVVIF